MTLVCLGTVEPLKFIHMLETTNEMPVQQTEEYDETQAVSK